MSLPAKAFFCAKCAFSQCDVLTWGGRDYVLPDGEQISIPCRLGWCEECDGLASVETFSAELFCGKIQAAERDLAEPDLYRERQRRHSQQFVFGSRVVSLPTGWNYEQASPEERLNVASKLLAMIEKRQSPPRCLKCGGTRVTAPLVSDWSRVKDPRLPTPIGFVHPGCGGELSVVEDGFRVALRPSIRRYTPEGEFIELVNLDERG